MKRLSALFSITIVSFLFISCVSPQQKAQRVWYIKGQGTYYFFIPKMLETPEEAISTIKFLKPNLGIYGSIIDLQIDKYGLLVKTSHVTTKTNYVVEPVTVSGFANSKISSYYSNTSYVGKNVTTSDTIINSHSLIFKNTYYISLYNKQYDRDGFWSIGFYNNNYKVLMTIYSKDKQSALDLIDAVFTLASKSGATIIMEKLGIFTTPFTLQQAATLGEIEQKGVVITEVLKDGPSEKSGIMVNDIITEIDGKGIVTDYDIRNSLNKKGKNKVKLSLIRMTNFNMEKKIYNYEQLEKEVSFN